MGAIIRDKFNDDDTTFGGSTLFLTHDYGAQTFTAGSDYVLSSIKLKILVKASSVNVFYCTCSLYAVDVDHKPTGSALATKTESPPWSAGDQWREFVFSNGPTLEAGTEYAIVLYSAQNDNTTGWRTDINPSGPDPYAGENFYSDDGSSWTNTHIGFAYADNAFETWGLTPSTVPADLKYTKYLVAACNNAIYYGTGPDDISVITDSIEDLDCTKPLTMTEAYEKVFIANRSNLKVVDFGNIKLTTASIQDGTGIPLNEDIITGSSSGASAVVDYITASAGACTVYAKRTTTATFTSSDTCTGTNGDGDAFSFDLSANETTGPHWYDWTVYANDTTTYGTMPTQADLICTYRGRVVLSGSTIYPYQWKMSRQANPWDFQYISTDAQSPIGGQDGDLGQVGDVITTLIPLKDDYLVFGGVSTLFLLEGDPADNGVLSELELSTGIYGFNSWCIGDNNSIYFLGNGGVYRISEGFNSIESLSSGYLPNFLENEGINASTHRVTLSYDRRRQGININITTISSGANSNFFFSLKTKGFYPETYPTACGVYDSIYYDSLDDTERGLIHGTYDGRLRWFLDTAKDDDSGDSDTGISSYFATQCVDASNPSLGLGDFQNLRSKNIVFEMSGGASSGEYTDFDGFSWEIHRANDPETALENIIDGATAEVSGSISSGGRSKRIRCRTRGPSIFMKVDNSTASQNWALNRVLFDIKGTGRVR